MCGFVTAWEFLTVIPLRAAARNPESADLAASMAWFPLVGLILGGLLVVTDLLGAMLFAPAVVNLLLIVVSIVVTGGLHIDGLADSIDGLAGGRTPADRLRIMRDVHVGAIGATGIMLALGLRYAGLTALPSSYRLPLLICMPLAGRWAIVLSSLAMPYARAEGGLAQPFLQQLRMSHVLWATLWFGVALVWSVGMAKALLLAVLVAVVARAISRLAYRLIGGITGDILGAVNELAEITFLIVAPAVVVLGPPHVWWL